MAMRSTNMAMGFRPPLLGKAPVATFFIPPFLGFRGSTLIIKKDEKLIIIVIERIVMMIMMMIMT